MIAGCRKAGGVIAGSAAGLMSALLAGAAFATGLEVQVARQDGALAVWADDPILGHVEALLHQGKGNVVDLSGDATGLAELAGGAATATRAGERNHRVH